MQSPSVSPRQRLQPSPKRQLVTLRSSFHDDGTHDNLIPQYDSSNGSPRHEHSLIHKIFTKKTFAMAFISSFPLLFLLFSSERWTKLSSGFSYETKRTTNLSIYRSEIQSHDSSLNKSSNDSISQNNSDKKKLDFAIIGFPKTGTTFLIYALSQHPEVIMPPDGTAPYEFCQIHSPNGHQELLSWLHNASSSAALSSPKVPLSFGIKCPTMVRSTNAIENMMKVSDSTKLIVGVRHPVQWFQSFYNYRVYEKYNSNSSYAKMYPIPSPFELNKTKEWRDVTVAYAKFEVYLKQLMKIPLTANEIKDMLKSDSIWEKRFSPNPYKIFLYTNEQLNDANNTRQIHFRKDLQEFLNLKTPLVDFNEMPEMNKHDEVYPEYIDLCEEKYSSIKNDLLNSGKKSSEWILNKFIESNDVIVSNKEFFTSYLRNWSIDPCKKKKRIL